MTASAKDASHQGMTYLEVKVDTGTNQVTGIVNTEGQFNSWGGSDVAESSEYKKEQITWGHHNWNLVSTLLNSNKITIPISVPTGGETFTVKGGSPDFESATKDLKEDGKGSGEAVALVMSFPGWGAGDRVPDVSAGNKSVSALITDGDRNGDDAGQFKSIDGTAAANSANAVSNKLIGGLNQAIADFAEQTRTNEGNKVQFSREGMANVIWLLASGKFPKPGTQVKYDDATGKISGEFVNMKVNKVKDPWNKSRAGETLVTLESPGKDGDKTEVDTDYVYAVVKGYQGGVGKSGSDTYASDAYALTWFDVAMSLSAQMVADTIEDESEASTTVVGDQVNSFMYTVISGTLGLFNIKKTDEVVFGESGNLLRSNVYNILNVVQAPFLAAAMLILGLVILEAYRKTNMNYLSTGEQRSVMSSVGRIANAVLAMAFTPLLAILLIYLDQMIVDFAIGLNALFNGFNYSTGWQEQMEKLGMFGSLINGVLGFLNPANLILAIVMAGIDIKFTWRYIARAISFGLYYCISPVLFALDALKGSGRLFEFGPTAGMIWKNMAGAILMRGMDALGIVFSLALSKILFGAGMLIKIMSLLSAEAISNTVAGMIGVQDSSIKGIAQTGEGIFNKAKTAIMAGAGVAATAVGSKAFAAYKSGKNKDDAERLAAMNGDPGAKPKAGSLQDEAQIQSGNGRTNPKLKSAAKSSAPGSNTGTGSSGTESGTNIAHSGGAGQELDAPVAVAAVSGAPEQPLVEGNAIDNGLGSRENRSGEGRATQTVAQVVESSAPGSNTGEEKSKSLWGKLKSGVGGSAIGNAFMQGATNKGIHGDSSTVPGGGMNRANRHAFDAKNYKLGERGQIVNKGLWDGLRENGKNMSGLKAGLAYKGNSLRDAGRGAVRALGGAATAFKPRDFAKIAAASAFAASSTLTKTSLDGYAATAITANMMQNTFTGAPKSSVGGNLARSFFGRSMGLKEGAMTFDEITADGYGNTSSALGKGEEKSEASKEMAKYSTERAVMPNDVDTMLSRTSFGGDVKNKYDKAAFDAASALHAKNGNGATTGGMTRMSLDQVINSIDDNAFNQVNPQFAQLSQYMVENGYERMHTNGDEVWFDSRLQRETTADLANAEDGSFERHLVKTMQNSQDHMTSDGNKVFKLTDDGNADVYGDTLAENRALMSNQYSSATSQAIKDGNGKELKTLLREQRDMAYSPDKFISKYPGGIPTPSSPGKPLGKKPDLTMNKG